MIIIYYVFQLLVMLMQLIHLPSPRSSIIASLLVRRYLSSSSHDHGQFLRRRSFGLPYMPAHESDQSHSEATIATHHIRYQILNVSLLNEAKVNKIQYTHLSDLICSDWLGSLNQYKTNNVSFI